MRLTIGCFGKCTDAGLSGCVHVTLLRKCVLVTSTAPLCTPSPFIPDLRVVASQCIEPTYQEFNYKVLCTTMHGR